MEVIAKPIFGHGETISQAKERVIPRCRPTYLKASKHAGVRAELTVIAFEGKRPELWESLLE